jgi:hypothetical protein
VDLDGYGCPESTGRHGPADGSGRCPWCRRRYEAAVHPALTPWTPSDLTVAYGTTYDPDFLVLTRDQIRHRYEMGLAP